MRFLPLLFVYLVFFQGTPNTDLPFNHYQWIGSHNSYKEYIDPNLFRLLEKSDTSRSYLGLEYHHVGLSDQLTLGLRSLEIDVYADLNGGKYAHPKGLDLVGENQARSFDAFGAMKEPGFKVLHIQEIDFRSNCLTLKACLQELKAWSDLHPDHEPIVITINAKDDTLPVPGFTRPHKFTSAVFDALDQAIQNGLGVEKIISPNSVRGNFSTLEEAVRKQGWPKRSKAKGKFLFILDENEEKTGYYVQNHPNLKDRICFVNLPEGRPEAVTFILNDPIRDQSAIQALVKKGFLVRTRADADTEEARKNDYTRFVAAMASGAQIISTDYYFVSTFFPSQYRIRFGDGGFYRKNPLFE